MLKSIFGMTLQEPRLKDLVRHGFLPNRCKVLDVAAGCGQFVRCALSAEYDCFGVEPDAWRLEYCSKKAHLYGRSQEWKSRVVQGIGEAIPFPDDEFDIVTTYQTFEHVQDPPRFLREMLRVTRAGGGIHIRCPDYRSTFEAHYQVPWCPLFPRVIAKLYLRLLGRPTAGLDTIQYVTGSKIRRWLSQIEKEEGILSNLVDDNRNNLENALRRRPIPYFPGVYNLQLASIWLKYFGRRELSVNLFVRILSK